MGGLTKELNVVPTGSLALDYELGIGGWPLGYCVGVFGARDIGKTSTLGFGSIRNAQALGLNCAIIAVEPNFDEKWAAKNGVDVDNTLLAYPASGEEAFAILHKVVRSGVVDWVVFDSIGAVISEVEIKEDGKPRQGGQAGLITWGIKAVAPMAFRNNVGVMFINQIRDDMKAQYAGMVKQPGGHGLEHHESIIVHLKRGSDRYTIKQAGQEVQIGQQIVAHIVRNKMAEGSGKRAVFDFFSMETSEYPFGIDIVTDTINTAKRTGVLRARMSKAGDKETSWYDLADGTAVNGIKALSEHLRDHPKLIEELRDKVLRYMLAREDVVLLEPPQLEAI